jgi:hypothetical protein
MGRVQQFVADVDFLGMLDMDVVSKVYLVYTVFLQLAVYPSSRIY